MFYEELDALFAFAIGTLIGVSASVIICIIIVLIPDTGMTAQNFAWVLLSSLGTAFASGFFILWMSRRSMMDDGVSGDDADLRGSVTAAKADGATDGGLDAVGRTR